MNEIILNIKEHDNLTVEYSSYDGYEITTDQNTYLILISNCQSCCELTGYISSPDNFNDFIGAEILKVNAVEVDEEDYIKSEILKNELEYVDVLEAAFIHFETNKGTLELAVYNSHNGYYGHEILLKVIAND